MALMSYVASRVIQSLSLAEWASKNRITYKTAWRMFHERKLPPTIRAEQLPTGTIRLFPALAALDSSDHSVTIYARINPRQERYLLEAQVQQCKVFCCARGWQIDQVVREIAPALGSKRLKLRRLLENPPQRLVIQRESVVSRFDFNLISQTLGRSGTTVTVVDQSLEIEGTGGVLEDLIDAISSTCRRHYGTKRGMLILEELNKIVRKKG